MCLLFGMERVLKLLTFLAVSAACVFAKDGQNRGAGAGAEISPTQAEAMWNAAWNMLFSPRTNLFYDHISSYEPSQRFCFLPKPDEVAALYPNYSGFGTGMEDSMILAGLALSAVVDRFAVEKDPSMKAYADKILSGIELCATVHKSRGFIARSVCVFDAKSAYVGSSRDQFTHALFGLWKYYNSPLCDAPTKRRIAAITSAVGERMLKYMTAENGFDYRRSDGVPCARGLSKMWNVRPHEAARLPMFYAIAWQTTGDKRFFAEYKKYAAPALEQSLKLSADNPSWVSTQMMSSLIVLGDVETDPALREKIGAAAALLVGFDNPKLKEACAEFFETAKKFDMSMTAPDWRKSKIWTHETPRWGDYHKVWFAGRKVGELAWACIEGGIDPDALKAFCGVVAATDYSRTSSCSIIHHLAAYWALRSKNFICW